MTPLTLAVREAVPPLPLPHFLQVRPKLHWKSCHKRDNAILVISLKGITSDNAFIYLFIYFSHFSFIIAENFKVFSLLTKSFLPYGTNIAHALHFYNLQIEKNYF